MAESDKKLVHPNVLPAAALVGAGGIADAVAALRAKAPDTFGMGPLIKTRTRGFPIEKTRELRKKDLDILSRFAKKHSVTAPILTPLLGNRTGNSYYFDPKIIFNRKVRSIPEHIGLGRASVPIALHELGHGSPILKSVKLRRGLHTLATGAGLGSGAGTLVRTLLIGAALMGPGDKEDGIRKQIYENAPVITAATLAPQLAEEARASIKALGGASRSGIRMWEIAKVLGPAFGSYLVGAAFPILATALAKHLGKRHPHKAKDDSVSKLEKTGAKSLRPPKKITVPPSPRKKIPPPKRVAMSGALRASASSAWKMDASKPKPKTIPPTDRIGLVARHRATAKPPSKRAFYRDMIKSLHNPQRGFRATVIA